jgi:hypothetical protein
LLAQGVFEDGDEVYSSFAYNSLKVILNKPENQDSIKNGISHLQGKRDGGFPGPKRKVMFLLDIFQDGA